MNLVDRLADIRLQIRALEQEAEEIKAKLFNGEIALRGENYVASVQHHVVLTPILR
jgi:hypothetical protein